MLSALIRLILLPVTVVRVLLWTVIWHFVYFFLKRPKLLVIALAFGGTFALLSLTPSSSPDLPPVNTEPPAKEGKKLKDSPTVRMDGHPINHPPPPEKLPEIPGNIKDGNSYFSRSLIEKMEEPELMYYSREFHHAMYYGKAGIPYVWSSRSGNMFGQIDVGDAFQSSSGVWCRHYKEILSFKKHAARMSGISCRRKTNAGWCKLPKGHALTCEVGRPHGFDGFMMEMKESIRGIF